MSSLPYSGNDAIVSARPHEGGATHRRIYSVNAGGPQVVTSLSRHVIRPDEDMWRRFFTATRGQPPMGPADEGRLDVRRARQGSRRRVPGQDGRLSFTTGFRSPFSASSYAAHSTPYAATRPSGRGWLRDTSKRFVYGWSPSSSRSKA